MAVVEFIFDLKSPSWLTGNTNVPKLGEPIFLSNGKYALGDGVTQVQSLPLYGGVSTAPVWGAITGILSNQTDLQNALNAKYDASNPSGYITSSALTPYLTSANAALTYQPIGSYLTGLTVGSTAIGSGTNTRILYNNAGVLGEYAVTGTGTTAVLSTSPTFTTDITTPLIIGGTGANQVLTFQNTTGATTSAGGAYLFKAGNLGSDLITINQGNFIFSPINATAGAITSFTFTTPANTSQTASTEISNFKVNGASKTWAAGAITTQRWNYFKANTAAFASASTITNSYGLYVEAATAGTNATITNNYAAGFSGAIQVTNNTTQIDDFTGGVSGPKRLRLRNSVGSATSYAQIDAENNGSIISSFGITSGAYVGGGVLTANTHFFIAQNGTAGNNILYGASGVSMRIKFINGGFATTNVAFEIDNNNNIICGNAALNTTATNGFLYVPSCAGTPTGVPTTVTGRVPIVADSTNNKLYMYSGGAWVAVN